MSTGTELCKTRGFKPENATRSSGGSRYPVGKAFIEWLYQEGQTRGIGKLDVLRHLGIGPAYASNLRSGLVPADRISDELAGKCAAFLQVPPIVVKLAAGVVTSRDLLGPDMTEEEVVARGIRRMLRDPAVRALLPVDVTRLPHDVKKALVLMYAEVSDQDLFGLDEAPAIARALGAAVTQT